jgi:hypothetical protein
MTGPSFFELWTERTKLRKQLRILRAALREIASEDCTYAGHGHGFPIDRDILDPECAGEVCTAKLALREARRVK